ncbi:MAG TPA: radical SAM protein, partial [Anaerolineales bacterium]|nr:radical SAM protein [Anaerolineales bacterium]
ETQARQLVAELFADWRQGNVPTNQAVSPEAVAGFERAMAFDSQRSQADAEQYHQVYKPVGILPPDQYMAVVLQATEGCAFNTCTFCDFYKDRPFRIKSPSEFLEHAHAVRDYLGPGLSLRRTIFLGDANALVAPMAKLSPLMDIVHQVYDVERLGGIYAFLDGFSGQKKTRADYADLARRGLKRVYIGMESGNAELLSFLRKPGQPQDALQAVRALKAGGVAVGVIVLLGAGGRQYARRHVADTIALLNAMPLDLEDVVYFSELILSEGMHYVQDAYAAELQPLDEAARQAQAEEIEAGLRFSEQGGVPHISRYDIREFVY